MYVAAIVGDDDKIPLVLEQIRAYFEEVRGMTVSVSPDQTLYDTPALNGSSLIVRAGRRVSDEDTAVKSDAGLVLINNTLADEVDAGRQMLVGFKSSGEKLLGVDLAHQLISVENLAKFWVNTRYNRVTVLLFPGQNVSDPGNEALPELFNNITWMNCTSVDHAADRMARNLESALGLPVDDDE